MEIIVQKYGGTSVATVSRIKSVAKRIIELRLESKNVVVVVSAMGDMTDKLDKMAKKITKEPNERELDMLLTVGERISIALLSMAINGLGFEAISFTGSQSGILTTNEHTNAKIIDVRCQRILDELEKGKIVIVAGFQGVSLEKEITTLGRGGSDTSAVALAKALCATRCDILTDVDGLYDVDPKIIKNAKIINNCSYETAYLMANSGARVLHTPCVQLAKEGNVPLYVASSFNKKRGTTIFHEQGVAKEAISAVTHISDLGALTFLHNNNFDNKKLFYILSQINAYFIINKEVDWKSKDKNKYYFFQKDNFGKIKKILDLLMPKLDGVDVVYKKNLSSVSLISESLQNEDYEKINILLLKNKIKFIAIGSYANSINIIVTRKMLNRAVRVVYRALSQKLC